MEDKLVLSTLPKTWIFDLDGTLVKHNGYKTDGTDTLLPEVREYFDSIPAEDRIVLLTARTDKYRQQTLDFLAGHHIRYDAILFNMPVGERILVNDRKPSGLDMSVAINIDRNRFQLPAISREK